MRVGILISAGKRPCPACTAAVASHPASAVLTGAMASEWAVKLSVQQRRFRRHVRDPAVTVGDVPNAATGTFRKARFGSLLSLVVSGFQVLAPFGIRGLGTPATAGATTPVSTSVPPPGQPRSRQALASTAIGDCVISGAGEQSAVLVNDAKDISSPAAPPATPAVCCSRRPHAHGGATALRKLSTTQSKRDCRRARNWRDRRRG